MALLVDVAFAQFHNLINLSGDHRNAANTRRDWIVSRLNPRFEIIDAFAMGSIPRYTALSGHADLDVMVALHYGKHIKDKSPAAVLTAVRQALGTAAGSVRRNGQAVTMRFSSWPNVDVVPASQVTHNGQVTGYSIPDMNRGIWLPSNPRAHTAKIDAAAQVRGPKFRQVIKMVKDWNRRQPQRLQSYHIEVIALLAGYSDDYSWSVLSWFDKAKDCVRSCSDGTSDITGYMPFAEKFLIQANLAAVTNRARDAWYRTHGGRSDHRGAIQQWKAIFGQGFPGYG